MRECCYNLLNEVDFGEVDETAICGSSRLGSYPGVALGPLNKSDEETAVVATALSYRYMATRTLRSRRMSANPCVWWLPARREAGSRGFKTLRRNLALTMPKISSLSYQKYFFALIHN